MLEVIVSIELARFTAMERYLSAKLRSILRGRFAAERTLSVDCLFCGDLISDRVVEAEG